MNKKKLLIVTAPLIALVLNTSSIAATVNNVQTYPIGTAVMAIDSATGHVSFCNWSCGYRIGNVGSSASGYLVTPGGSYSSYILNKSTGNLYQCYTTTSSNCQIIGSVSSM